MVRPQPDGTTIGTFKEHLAVDPNARLQVRIATANTSPSFKDQSANRKSGAPVRARVERSKNPPCATEIAPLGAAWRWRVIRHSPYLPGALSQSSWQQSRLTVSNDQPVSLAIRRKLSPDERNPRCPRFRESVSPAPSCAGYRRPFRRSVHGEPVSGLQRHASSSGPIQGGRSSSAHIPGRHWRSFSPMSSTFSFMVTLAP